MTIHRTRRVDAAHPTPLFHVSWEEDSKFRMSPEVVTTLLREQVPILTFVDWRVTSIEPGVVSSILPLNAPSTNQHFTHQAAVFLLAADYTGGTALASLLQGWPVVGVHPVTSAESMSLWLLKTEVKYIRPSVGDLQATCTVDPARRQRIQQRFVAGKPVIETFTIKFFNGDELVAEATATYFARQSTALRAQGLDADRVNSLYALKLTSSAELIAGVRARQTGTLFEDPYAAEMAGKHGVALAERFCERSPQLGGMVAARTRHLDAVVANFLAAGGRHLAAVGVGWDMRPFRLDMPRGAVFYELDFPTTLIERERRLTELGLETPSGVERVSAPIDLRTMPLAETLQQHLPDDEPVLILWEGMSMYFDEAEVREVLAGFVPVLTHPKSLLWLDLVDRAPIESPQSYGPSVEEFMRGMQILGEPFTFGSDRPTEFLADCGLNSLEVVPSGIYFSDVRDPIYEIYRFCTVNHAAHAAGDWPATFQPTRLDTRQTVPAPHFRPEAAQGRREESTSPSPVVQEDGTELPWPFETYQPEA